MHLMTRTQSVILVMEVAIIINGIYRLLPGIPNMTTFFPPNTSFTVTFLGSTSPSFNAPKYRSSGSRSPTDILGFSPEIADIWDQRKSGTAVIYTVSYTFTSDVIVMY